jgi:hypothetical protein
VLVSRTGTPQGAIMTNARWARAWVRFRFEAPVFEVF